MKNDITKMPKICDNISLCQVKILRNYITYLLQVKSYDQGDHHAAFTNSDMIDKPSASVTFNPWRNNSVQ